MAPPVSLSYYGLLAEFADDEALVHAAQAARAAGYTRVEAYSPFPIAGLPAVLGVHGRRLPRIVLAGGILGGLGGLLLQWYSASIAYPFNIGGRPHASWPMFVPVTFELTILVAAFAAVLGMFALNGLPQPYHPLFNVPEFAGASRDRFFLCIEATDPQFDLDATRSFLQAQGARQLFVVEP